MKRRTDSLDHAVWEKSFVLMIRNNGPATTRGSTVLDSLRLQLAINFGVAVLLPVLLVYYSFGDESGLMVLNSVVGSFVALVMGLLLQRRVSAFPGTRAFAFILPSLASSYGLVIAAFFVFRLGYSRVYVTTSFTLALIVAFGIGFWLERYSRSRFYVVPSESIETLLDVPDMNWIVMSEPSVPADPRATIVADLRCDHGDDWERMLAVAAVRGHPVYHAKLLRESLTGRVTIEHLSENSFGSLLPNLAYRKAKRMADIVACIVLAPLLALPLAIVALLIKLDSRGPVFFVQERMGYRSQRFRMIKFRTMHPRPPMGDEEAARQDAMTKSDDNRITRVGAFLRRSRIDELPQIVNVFLGHMSWIGPRPEAVPLSSWYEREIPFYSYRHIVRPGITGWAQVHQGHVTDLDDVSRKLAYDFYYIKYFSAWLDVVIAMRTVMIVLSGFGAK